MLRVSNKIAQSIKQQGLLQSCMRFSSKPAKSTTPEEKIPEPLTNPSILYTGVRNQIQCKIFRSHFFSCKLMLLTIICFSQMLITLRQILIVQFIELI